MSHHLLYHMQPQCSRIFAKYPEPATLIAKEERTMLDFRPHPFPGKLIGAEAIGGGGKSTQVRKITELLRQEGRTVIETSLPQYDLEPYGPLIRDYLQDPEANRRDPYEVASWYIANRVDFRPQVEEWLKNGNIVLCARSPLSNVAYQGAKLPAGYDLDGFCERLLKHDYLENRWPREDLLILLKSPVRISLTKAEERGMSTGNVQDGRDGHEQDEAHMRRVLQIYERFTTALPFGTVIDCAPDGQNLLPPKEITNLILEKIRPALP
jgi:thymidylate kinase